MKKMRAKGKGKSRISTPFSHAIAPKGGMKKGRMKRSKR
jgi:hypothetical protein